VSNAEKSKLIDRKRLLLEYGFTGATADKIMRDCRTFQYPGERKTYVLREDVERVLDDYTLDRVSTRRIA
jgi:hypothetical protein